MLHAHFLPTLISATELAGRFVVVIDVLRASTTISHALASGASAVIPCVEVEEARRLANEMPRGTAILGGERGGLPIDGFDLGNSPSEYSPTRVAGQTIVFTTTNGTQAMRRCAAAERVMIGAFVNLSAICQEITSLVNADRDAHLLCAGTRGAITGEDVLFAGAVAHRLATEFDRLTLNDQAHLARLAWQSLCPAGRPPTATQLADHLAKHTQGGRNVTRLGLGADIVDAATLDRFDFAPELHLAEWRIDRTNR